MQYQKRNSENYSYHLCVIPVILCIIPSFRKKQSARHEHEEEAVGTYYFAHLSWIPNNIALLAGSTFTFFFHTQESLEYYVSNRKYALEMINCILRNVGIHPTVAKMLMIIISVVNTTHVLNTLDFSEKILRVKCHKNPVTDYDLCSRSKFEKTFPSLLKEMYVHLKECKHMMWTHL